MSQASSRLNSSHLPRSINKDIGIRRCMRVDWKGRTHGLECIHAVPNYPLEVDHVSLEGVDITLEGVDLTLETARVSLARSHSRLPLEARSYTTTFGTTSARAITAWLRAWRPTLLATPSIHPPGALLIHPSPMKPATYSHSSAHASTAAVNRYRVHEAVTSSTSSCVRRDDYPPIS